MNAPETIYLPPHSIEAEQSVLGGILLSGGTALDRIEGLLTEKDFYHTGHRQIFSAITSLANSSRPIDTITVAEALEGSGSLANVGGLPYLGSLAQNVPSVANIASYSKIVRERALQRNLLALAQDISASCYAPGADVTGIINRADAAMVQLLGNGSSDEPNSLTDCMADAIADIDNRATGHQRSGLLTGVADFDALTCGLEPGQLVIIAARPSVGKTALALNIADHVTQRGETVAFFSLEMTRRELAQRLIALRARVSVTAMRSGQLDDDDQWNRISACQAKADGQRLFLIDRSAIGVAYVRAAARKIKRQHGLALIVVDYLGLMRGEGQNRTQEIGSLSRGLKALAKELHVPIIALAQLNCGNENRQDKRPQLSDLRDSGEVEQDADIVAMLHAEATGFADLLVRKNRNGALGTVSLRFEGEHMRFSKRHGQTAHQSPTNQQKGFD
jgi:replicative DNA helicase